MSNSLRDMFVGIQFDDGASKTINRIDGKMDELERGFIKFGSKVDKSAQGLRSMGSTGEKATSKLEKGLDKSEKEAKGFAREVNNSDNALRGLKSTAMKIAGVIGGIFAVDKIKEFAVSGIEKAASVKALNSQFDQVYEGLQDKATGSLNAIANETGVLPERLKGSFVQLAAFAKTTGVDTAAALSLTERATLAAADSAAFYDRSIEDVTDNLQSLLKGNFENDAALGISVTETTRNAKAMELYNKKFKDLSEAQKQLTLLQMVEDGNKAAGAIGQAAREADGYENVIGNMKSSWDKLKGSMMNPFLDTVTGSLQGLTAKLSSIDGEAIGLKMKKGFDLAKDVVMSLYYDTGEVSDLLQNFGLPKETSDNLAGFANLLRDSVTTGIEGAKIAFDGFKEVMGWALDNQEPLIAGLSGVAAGFAALKVINAVNGMLALYKGSAFASTVATQGFNAALRANPIGLIVTGIGLAVAAGVALYRNWDTVKGKTIELWNKLNENPFTSFLLKLNPVVAVGTMLYKNFDKIKGSFNNFKDAITNFKLPGWVNSVGGAIGGAVSKVTSFVNGSHATGLANVPFDDYRANLHKGESVLTADQSSTLRGLGVLGANSDGTPTINPAALSTPVPVSTPVNNASGGGSIQVSVPIELNIQGNADDATIQKLLSTLDSEVRRIFEDIFRQKLAGMGG